MSLISYYAVIPSWVLSHSSLSPSEKLMCALISAMSQKNGYCFATNEALATALSVSESSVKHVLANLETANVIAIHNKKTKKAGNRHIWLMFAERIEEDKEIKDAPELPRNEIEDAFDRFYEVYPRKEKKILALKMFKSKKIFKRIDELVNAAKRYASTMSETDKQFIMLPATFLNNQIWEEHISAVEEGKKISNGAALSVDPFDSFLSKCSVLSQELFNSAQAGELPRLEEDRSWDISRFDDKELSVITAVGFVNIMRNISDGEFINHEIKPAWESIG